GLHCLLEELVKLVSTGIEFCRQMAGFAMSLLDLDELAGQVILLDTDRAENCRQIVVVHFFQKIVSKIPVSIDIVIELLCDLGWFRLSHCDLSDFPPR